MQPPRSHPLVRSLAMASLVVLAACGRAPDAGPDIVGESQLARPIAAAGTPADLPPSSLPRPAAVAAPMDSTGAGQPAGRGVQRVAVIDPNGFEKPMPALWVQIPAGWATGGGIVWDQNAPCGATPGYQWQAQSPDGQRSLRILPPDAWSFDNLNLGVGAGNCPRWPITDVRSYLQSLVERQRPGARVLDFRLRNDLVREPPLPSDTQTRSWKEGGEMLVSYTGPQGEMRESYTAVVQFTETTMAGVMPGEVRKFMSGVAGSPVVATAPAGQLDLAMVSHFAMTAEPDPQWRARMDQHNTAIARRGMQGQAERGQIAAQTRREVADINQQGWQGRSDSSDAIQRQTIDGINNVDRYTDPVTGNQVQLDNRYDNAWRANDGTYIQSNDPNLNPRVDLGIEAEQMERHE